MRILAQYKYISTPLPFVFLIPVSVSTFFIGLFKMAKNLCLEANVT